MVARPAPTELLGLIGLVVGFVVFTLGVLTYFGGRQGLATVAVVVAGGLLGFVAAGFLVVYYHVSRIVGE